MVKSEYTGTYRHFTMNEVDGKIVTIGTVKIKEHQTPIDAAKKILSCYCRHENIKSNKRNKVNIKFTIIETTMGHSKIYGPYKGYFIKYDKPVIIKVKNGKVIKKTLKPVVKVDNSIQTGGNDDYFIDYGNNNKKIDLLLFEEKTLAKISEFNNKYTKYRENSENSENRKNNNITKSIKEIIQEKLFDETDIPNFEQIITNFIQNNTKNILLKNKSELWIKCEGECLNLCKQYILKEINSTAYILKILSGSVVGDEKNYKVSFLINYELLKDIKNLTGIWNNDAKYFDIKIINISNFKNDNLKNGRLIMGFGPSASGKTYCANLLSELMSIVDNNFPKLFLGIDGGKYRELSFFYNKIVNLCQQNKIAGFTNLVDKINMFSIYNSDIVKKTINNYLLSQKNKNAIINLYVPDTISFCTTTCYSKYEKYIEITGDKNWIATMIYQHKTQELCPFKGIYKCIGCTTSGEERQKSNGKKYSSDAWDKSFKHGNYALSQGPKYRFKIHNCGKYKDTETHKSFFEDLSIYNNNNERIIYKKNNEKKDVVRDFFTKNKWEYYPGKFNDKCHSIFLHKKCKEYNYYIGGGITVNGDCLKKKKKIMIEIDNLRKIIEILKKSQNNTLLKEEQNFIEGYLKHECVINRTIYRNNLLEKLDVSGITDMSELFKGFDFSNEGTYNQNYDISEWNVTNVTNMSRMFENCKNFNQNLNKWNFKEIEDMSYMFLRCKFVDSFNLNFTIHNNVNLNNMFLYCYDLFQTVQQTTSIFGSEKQRQIKLQDNIIIKKNGKKYNPKYIEKSGQKWELYEKNKRVNNI